MHVAPHMYKTITLKANAKDIITLKCIWHQICYKIVTLKANAQKIVTWKCIWHHICTKLLLWRQILRKSLLYKCLWLQICTKSLLWRQNAKEIITLKCVWHQICTKLYYFEGKCSGNCYFQMHLTPNMHKIISLKTYAKKIVTLKLKWFWCQICTKSLLWRQMLISCTTLKDQQWGLDMERWLTPGEILLMKDLLHPRG